jgi:hypothetical protein
MKALASALAAVSAALVMLVLAGPTAADTNQFGTCPDGYTPTPFVVRPDDDKNGNGVVCIKAVDEHINGKDDPNGKKYACNGFPTPPPECAGAEFVFLRDDLL